MIISDNYGSCPSGQCFNKDEICDTDSKNCIEGSCGCQAKYGKCIEIKCEKGIGKCLEGQCCSKKGYCSNISGYCSIGNKCQPQYGGL
ncbi:hypothetical protein PIROE2DRAFT_6812 [Piromyces sp. E2]|nr:hypothetical protein PIROE2DRAFT_6812 [Piromyces sp. E2]|eukprot:OUM66100.1 hypothetical protein PIROE2DRAFT_6812 [Piromyces sp. E2]